MISTLIKRAREIRKQTWDSGIECGDGSPLSSALLASLVEDFVDDRLSIVIFKFEDVGGDVDEEGVQDTLIPRQEDVGDLVFIAAETALEDVVSLSDQLHVTVFDSWNNCKTVCAVYLA